MDTNCLWVCVIGGLAVMIVCFAIILRQTVPLNIRMASIGLWVGTAVFIGASSAGLLLGFQPSIGTNKVFKVNSFIEARGKVFGYVTFYDSSELVKSSGRKDIFILSNKSESPRLYCLPGKPLEGFLITYRDNGTLKMKPLIAENSEVIIKENEN